MSESTNGEDRLVTFRESAKRLGCTRESLHKIGRAYGLKKVTLPGRTRARGFLASDIDALLKSGKGK